MDKISQNKKNKQLTSSGKVISLLDVQVLFGARAFHLSHTGGLVEKRGVRHRRIVRGKRIGRTVRLMGHAQLLLKFLFRPETRRFEFFLF